MLNLIKTWLDYEPGSKKNNNSIVKHDKIISVASNAVLLANNYDIIELNDKKLKDYKNNIKNDCEKNECEKNECENEEYKNNLKTNYATGCSTILDIARMKSNYNPFKSTNIEYDRYIEILLKSPFLHHKKSEEINYKKSEKNWNSTVDDILNLFDGVEDYEKKKIRNSLVNIIKSVSLVKNENTVQKLFFENIIKIQNDKKVNDEIQLFLYSSEVEITNSSQKSIDCLQLIFQIKKIELRFNSDLWFNFSDIVSKRSVKLITDWLKENTISEDELPTNLKLCIE